MNKAGHLQTKIKKIPLAWSLIPVILFSLLLSPIRPVFAAQPVTTTVQITSIAPSPAYIGQMVEINVRAAAVDPLAGIPTGRVEIRSGQDRVCTLTLDAAGLGVCLLSFDQPATVPLKAIYLGQGNFLPSVSTEINLLVKNKHTPLVRILSHLPDPSIINTSIEVNIRLTSDGPVPTGSATVWRSTSSCANPPSTSAADQCAVTLAAGAGSCTMNLSAPGDVYLCAAYAGDAFSFPAQAVPELHFVSDSNTFTIITGIDPEPSLLGEMVWVSFQVGSPFGVPMPTDLVKVTSEAMSCTATVAEGRCPLTFTTPHLHNVYAAYQGSASQQPNPPSNEIALEPSTSRAFVHRVNAPPTNILLSRDRVNSFLTAGKEAAAISALDPNTDEKHVFSLVPGVGSEHNSLFRISGDRLLINEKISQSLSRVSIRIRATDPAGLSFEKVFTLRVSSEAQLPATGFAANQATRVIPQPLEKSYQKFASVILEIPALGIEAEITGVPASDDGWDTTWLWQQVGWLNGTAFPGWRGNSVLAAHNFLPNGDPGPFAQLDTLRWGDEVLVHAHGETAVYEVRSVGTARPNQSSVLAHEESPWLTLISCKVYDATNGTYRLRVVVRAEWVEVR